VAATETLQYREVLRRVHEHCRPRVYGEIGVKYGGSVVLAQPGTKIIGIDPTPAMRVVAPPLMQFLELTSDDFFDQHSISELAGAPADVSFIDGWHAFEFALRDFRNLERNSVPDGIILFHDCFPPDETKLLKAGDVWKLSLALAEYRPDLVVSTVEAPPTGLGLVRSLDPTSTVLWDRYDEIIERFAGLDYNAARERADFPVHRVASTWPAIKALLPADPYRPAATADRLRAASRRSLRRARRMYKRSSARLRKRLARSTKAA
jgi:hypothetical protein